MLIIQRPEIEAGEPEGNLQQFTIAPLEPGFGHTLGNSLRRTLLSSIPGAAVTQVRFDEALHEFDVIKGVKEDVTDVILNLKDLVLRCTSDEPVTLRLDNIVFRAGFASSRSQARQFVRHGHVSVNGKRVTIPSYTVRKDDVVAVSDKARRMIVIRHNIDTLDRIAPQWLDVNAGQFQATVRDLPLREQIDVPVREQLIVELYSK